MRRIILILVILFVAVAAHAQNTTVTATVTDPSAHPYVFGTGYAALVCPGNQAPTYNGFTVNRTYAITGLDGTGTFTQVVFDVSVLVPVGCGYQWHITYKDGVTTFITGTITTVTGSSVNESAAISAYAVPLPIPPSSPGPVLQTNGTSNSNQSILNLINGTNVSLVADAFGGVTVNNTSAATIAGSIANTQVAFGAAPNTVNGNSGFVFITPNLSIPSLGAYEIGGSSILSAPVPANSNLAVGLGALPALTTGQFNAAIGTNALSLNTTGTNNTAVGALALEDAAAGAGNNTAVGSGALIQVTSNGNTAVGQGALQTLTSGNENTVVGDGAGANATGSGNTLIGYLAGNSISSGGGNIVLGNQSGTVISTGSGNTVIGNASSAITPTASNQLDIMDVIVGSGMNVPSTSTVAFEGALTVHGAIALAEVVCTGQISLTTGAINSGARATNTLSCTGLSTSTDSISCTFSGDTNAVTGYAPSASGGITLKTWVSTNTVNVDQVNNTASPITPGAATVNCKGLR